MFDAADNQVHVFVEVAATLGDNVHLEGLAPSKSRAFKIKSGVVMVDDLE